MPRRNTLGIFFEQVEGGFEKRRNGDKDVLTEEKSFAPQCLIFRHKVFAPPSYFHIVVPAPSLEPLDSLAPLRAASSSRVGSAPPRLLPHFPFPSHWAGWGADARDWLAGWAQGGLRAQRRCAPLAHRLAGAQFSFNLVCLLI